jgi:putative transposase
MMVEDNSDDRPGWAEACRREAAIRDLLDRHPKRLRMAAVDDVAWELGVSRATLYRLIVRYRATRTVEGLCGPGRGRPEGTQVLEQAKDRLIREIIEQEYLKPTRPPFLRVYEHIRIACRQRGWSAPSWRTAKSRLLSIDQRVRAVRRGDATAISAMTPTPGEYIATRPLEIVQIDHTLVDVIVVDEQSRAPMRRPWITLAMDVQTRMVVGFYLSLDAPSRASIGLCLLHAVYDKTSWMAERDIDVPWPVAGLPETLHADNGPDFRSRAFERACRNYGIQLIWRPPGQPHFGGHIERLIGTQMGAVHLLPGTTFSNPSERGSYQSSHAARMTLRELERWIGWEIAGHYHQRIHRGLHRPPIAVWREYEERLNFRLPVDRLQFWVSFLPEEERTLRRDGIHFCHIRYWSDALAADVGHAEGKLLIKYDPRDLSRIFVRRPSGRFVEARYRNLSWPAITLAEQQAAVRQLKAQGRHEIDETMIFLTTIRQREIEDNAQRQTAAARRRREQRPLSRPADKKGGNLKGIDSRRASSEEEGSGTWREH